MKQISSLLLPLFLCVLPLCGKRPFVGNPKAEAVIINAAVGDALGRVTEFIDTTKQIHAQFGAQGVTSLSQVTITHPITKQTIAPYTDDIVMSLMVLKACGRIHSHKGDWPTCAEKVMDELAREFADLFGSEKYAIDPLYKLRAHGIRNATAGTQLNELIATGNDQTKEWYLNRPVSDIPFEGGCGSVMRAWPIGLLWPNCPNVFENIHDLAHRQSELTHRHPMAIAASVAMAVGTACAYRGFSVDKTIEAMIDSTAWYDKRELNYKKNAKKWPTTKKLTAQMVAQDQLLTSDMIRYAYEAAKAGKTPQEVLGTCNDKQTKNYRSPYGYLLGWAADEAIAGAVYLFVRNSNNVDQALKEGVNTPGDSDSIASLAAVLVSAKTGQLCSDSNLDLLENKDTLVELASLIPMQRKEEKEQQQTNFSLIRPERRAPQGFGVSPYSSVASARVAVNAITNGALSYKNPDCTSFCFLKKAGSFSFPHCTATTVGLPSVIFLGDVMTSASGNFPELDKKLVGLIRSADVIVANIESPVVQNAASCKRGWSLRFKMNTAYLQALYAHNPNAQWVFGIANNHACDTSDKDSADISGIEETIKAIKQAMPHVAVVGAETAGASPVFTVKLAEDFTLGIIAWTDVMNHDAQHFQKPIVRGQDLDAKTIAAVKKAYGIDILIGFGHGNEEQSYEPLKVTRDRWKKLMGPDSCDVIVGTGPHVVHPSEEVQGGLIFHSIGNFCSPRGKSQTKIGCVPQITFSGNKVKGMGISYVAHFIQQNGEHVSKIDVTEGKALYPQIIKRLKQWYA